jgi:hypothetical protein
MRGFRALGLGLKFLTGDDFQLWCVAGKRETNGHDHPHECLLEARAWSSMATRTLAQQNVFRSAKFRRDNQDRLYGQCLLGTGVRG